MRPLLITIGTLSVALGVVGMFIPILPTTPFLLLAAACYARSSDRFLHWLLYNRWFGSYIRNYREGRGMPRTTKILTLAALWLTLGISAAFAVSGWWVRLLLVVIGIGVTVHLLRIQTYDGEDDPGGIAAARNAPPASDDP
ncbi:MAG: YbaN family protein [Chloroflexota bacterium]